MPEVNILNIMLTARDLGISPFKALNGGFYVLPGGKISMSTALMADRIRKAGHSIRIVEWSFEKCVIIGKRTDNEDSVKVEYTKQDAEIAGLWNGSTWKKYPKAMLYNRAMSMLARVLFPDVVGNCYSEDEQKEFLPKEELVEIYEPLKIEPEPEPTETLQELCEILKNGVMFDAGVTEIDILEYLEFCKSKAKGPIREAVQSWVRDQEKFLSFFGKWMAKKKVESTCAAEQNSV